MKIIALVNQKGGTAKSCSTVNIGAGLAKLKKKVLLVDLDPQAHLTVSLGVPSHQLKKTVYEVLKSEATISEAIVTKNKIDIVPASIGLAAADLELGGNPGREFLLKEALEELPKYDYVLLDCPPSLGLLTLNALTAAKEIYIPVQTEFLALQGIKLLLDTLKVVQRRLNPNLKISGVICSRYDKRKKLNQEVVETIKKHFPKKVFKTMIRENISLAEAPSHGKSIFEYKPSSNGAKDYISLCKEILKRKNSGKEKS